VTILPNECNNYYQNVKILTKNSPQNKSIASGRLCPQIPCLGKIPTQATPMSIRTITVEWGNSSTITCTMYVVKQSLIFVHILCISLFKRFSCWLPSFAVSWFSTFMVNNRLESNNFDQFHVHYSWRILCTRCSVPDSNHSGLSLRYITLLIKKYAPLYHF